MHFLISDTQINPFYLVGIGFIIGLLGGFFGVGGSFLAGPALFAVGVPMNFVVGTDLIVSGVDLFGPAGPVVDVGAGYPLAALWYEAWFVSAFVVLFQAYWRGESPGFRRRVRSLLAVLSTAGLLASVTEVFWPILTDSPGNLGLVSIYMLAITVGASAAEVWKAW